MLEPSLQGLILRVRFCLLTPPGGVNASSHRRVALPKSTPSRVGTLLVVEENVTGSNDVNSFLVASRFRHHASFESQLAVRGRRRILAVTSYRIALVVVPLGSLFLGFQRG